MWSFVFKCFLYKFMEINAVGSFDMKQLDLWDHILHCIGDEWRRIGDSACWFHGLCSRPRPFGIKALILLL